MAAVFRSGRRARAGTASACRTVILAMVAAPALTAIGGLAVVARHQASAKLNAQRKLATASDQLDAASQELGRTNSELATAQSSLADTQTRAQTAQDTLGQVKAAEVDGISPFLVDDSTTLDEARCIVNGVIDRLGGVPLLRYANTPPSTQMPPELERAFDLAGAACVPAHRRPDDQHSLRRHPLTRMPATPTRPRLRVRGG